jgi:hypothetical protein
VKAGQIPAFIVKSGNPAKRPDCLAGDAVLIAPVSGEFPENREFYREICDFRRFVSRRV